MPYIVMEFVEGKTLRDLIRAKEVTIGQAIDYCLGVLGALEYSHKRRHRPPGHQARQRDVLRGTNSIKVMDFGIARAMADSSATMTQTQAVVGTAQYLSPEQARGETVDARSDLYSAACLLYEMLTSQAAIHRRQPRFRGIPARPGNSGAAQQHQPRGLTGARHRHGQGAAEEP